MSETTPIYLGEARLIRWAISDSAGRTITLEIPDETPRHPFEGVPTGKDSGQRMKIICIALDDHEQPVDAKHVKRPKKGKTAPNGAVPEKLEPAVKSEKTDKWRSSRAYLMCREPDFYAWLTRLCERHLPSYRHGMTADEMLKAKIGITSKSELDTNPEAAAQFDAIRTDFELRDMVRS